MIIEPDERRVDLSGCTLDEAKAKVREFIDSLAEEGLEGVEIAMIDHGADPDEVAAELARARVQNAQEREKVIEKMAAWVARGGNDLH